MGTMASALCFDAAAGMSPQGAPSARSVALGLWVQRYCAGLSVPFTPNDQGVTIPTTERTNPTTTMAAWIIPSPNRATKSA